MVSLPAWLLLPCHWKGTSRQAGREAEGQLLERRPAPSAEGHLGRVGAASPAGETLLGLRGMFMGTQPQGRAETAPASFTSAGTQAEVVGQNGSKKNTPTFIFVTTNSCWYCFKNGIKVSEMQRLLLLQRQNMT